MVYRIPGAVRVGVHAFAVLACGAVLASASSVHAVANQVTSYGVDEYSPCCNNTDDCDLTASVSVAKSFYSKLVSSSGGAWRAGTSKAIVNDAVKGRAMGDPDWSGQPLNNDSTAAEGFDRFPGVAFYEGHGLNGPAGASNDGVDGKPFLACNSNPAQECPAPPAGTVGPPYCSNYPRRSPCPQGESCLTIKSFCAYQFQTKVSVCNTAEANTSATIINLSRDGAKEMRLGESGSTAWASAGSDGAIRFATLFGSHLIKVGAPGQNVWGVFGGINLLLLQWTNWGDAANTADAGPALAQLMVDFPDTPVKTLVNSMANATKDGGGCRGWKTDGTPHMGANGCGGFMLITLDSTQARVSDTINNRTVTQLRSGAYGQGNGWRSFFKTCNYDCATYPPIVGSTWF